MIANCSVTTEWVIFIEIYLNCCTPSVKQNRKVCVRFEAPQINSLISCINDQRCEYVCENNKDSNNLVTLTSSPSIETLVHGKVSVQFFA